MDVNVSRDGDAINCGIYRKTTFTGMGTSFFSFTTIPYKLNGLNTFLCRAFRICSNHTILCRELSAIQEILFRNGFPRKFVISKIRKFIESWQKPKNEVPTVSKKLLYISIPYLGKNSEIFGKNLVSLLDQYFFHVDFKVAFSNKFTIGSFFRGKDKLPLDMRSNIVYRYRCPTNCGGQYVGCTSRNFRTRMYEHMGRSPRTDRPLARPVQSAIRDHSERCGVLVDPSDFEILGTANSFNDLKILESLFIYSLRPNLNNAESSFPLKIT